MSYNSRRILTPGAGASRKRKERETIYPATSAKPLVPSTSVTRAVTVSKPNPNPVPSRAEPSPQPMSSNRLLAGYMAYEFLTNGTLFGQKFDPARAEAVPVSSAELKRNNSNNSREAAEPSVKSTPQSYAEVANLMKTDGAHIPGVVNPTQLAKWIKM